MSNLPGSRTDEHTDVTAIMMDRHEMAKHTSKGAVPYILLSAVVQGVLSLDDEKTYMPKLGEQK